MLFAFCSCEVAPDRGDLMKNIAAAEAEGKELDDAFCKAQTAFAMELFRACAADSKGKSILISPLSVHAALAMAANGASGETLAEMESLLGGELSVTELNAYFLEYIDSIPIENTCKVGIANSIWYNQSYDLEMREDFLQTNATYYGAQAYDVPFGKSAVEQINKWANLHTDGMIEKILDEMDEESPIYLVNALTFEAGWTRGFEKRFIQNETFCDLQGNEQTAQMMYAKRYAYYETEGAAGFALGYGENSRFWFFAVLPDEGVDLYTFIESFDASAYARFLSSRREDETVLVGLPKFGYQFDMELQDVLAALGMPSAFQNADFSRMCDASLSLDKVIHKTFIELDENGTRAAAVTVDTTKSIDLPKCDHTVVLNRPFVYLIADALTGAPIFIGTVTSV